MKETIALYSLFILFGTFISSISQVMLKKAAMKQYPSKIREYVNPLVITAYLIFVVATLCSVIAYRGVPLSLGPVLEATSYIYVTIFGVKIFHEKVKPMKILALVLIIAGIITAAL
jgi:multidrug transporter EmrE-like cation transporter